MNNELSTITNSMDLWDDQERLKEIKAIFAPKLTNNEFSAFIGMGKANDLNPFTREIWAIKYADNAPAQIFIGRDGYRKSAQRNPDYQTHIVESVHEKDEFKFKNGEVHHEYGAVRGKLIGAYCMVYKKSCERPTYVYCLLSEYSTGKSLWNAETGKQATMIKKVAEAQALRMAFQEQYSGTYSEFERHEIIDATYEVKQSQKDKMQSLLTKKGFNNASTVTSTENISNDSNAVNMSTDIDLFHSDSNIKQADTRPTGRVPVAEAPESEIKNNDKTTAPNKCTKEQLENIEFKMQMSGEFDDARRLKALKHFGINTFPELTFEQAEELIKIIDKA